MESGKIRPLEIKSYDEIDEEMLPKPLEGAGTIGFGKPKRLVYYALKIFQNTFPVLATENRGGDLREDYWYVYPEGAMFKDLRAQGWVKQIRPVLCQEIRSGDIFLWPIKITHGNSYYDSLTKMLANPEVGNRSWMIKANTDKKEYEIRWDHLEDPVEWPDKDESEWMAEVFPPERIIGPDDRAHVAIEGIYRGKLLD